MSHFGALLTDAIRFGSEGHESFVSESELVGTLRIILTGGNAEPVGKLRRG